MTSMEHVVRSDHNPYLWQLASPMGWMDLPGVSESDLTAFVTSSVDERWETDDVQIGGHRIV